MAHLSRSGNPSNREVLQLIYLPKYACLRARSNLLTLMRGDGAETATAKAPAVHTHREANHLVGGYVFAFVFRVWMILERQVVYRVQFFGSHRWVGWIHHYILISHGLNDSSGIDLIALCLDQSEVLRVHALALDCLFVAVEDGVEVE